MPLKKGFSDTLALVVLLLITLLFFSKTFLFGELYYIRDIYGVGYQWLHLVIERFKAGYIPLWNPYQLSGVPHLANLGTMSLYPLNTLFYFSGLTGSTYIYFGILHIFLGGAFLYALVRHWRCSPIPALLASISYMFSGYSIDFESNFPITWLPLIFLFLDKALSLRIESILLAGLFLGLQLLTGGIEIAFFTLLALGLYALFMSLGIQKGWFKRMVLNSVILVLVGSIGISLAMVQFLPSQELASQSVRSERLDYEAASSHPLHPLGLIEFFIPHFFGKKTDVRFWGEPFYDNAYAYYISIYFGVLTIMSGALAIICLRNKRIFYLTTLLLLSVILALGPYTPIHYLVYRYVPLMGSLRIPVKYLILTTFAASVLAGFGVQFLLTGRSKSNELQPESKTLSYFLLLISCFWILSLFLAIFLFIDYFNYGSLVQLAFSQYLPQEILLNAVPDIHKEVFRSFVLILIGMIVILLTGISKLSPRVSGPLLVFMLVIDLFLAHMHLHPTVPNSFYSEPSSVINLFDKEGSLSRFYRHLGDEPEIPYFVRDEPFKRYFWFKNTLFPYYSVQNRVYDLGGSFSLRLREYGILLHALDIAPLPAKLKLLSLFNVRYILSFSPLKIEGLKPLAFFPDLKMGVYENTTYLPRAYFVPQGKRIDGRTETLNALVREDFDPKKEVVLSDSEISGRKNAESQSPNLELADNIESFSDSMVKILDYQPDRAIIVVSTTQKGYLIFADSYYPGWKAYVDEQDVKILRANYLLRAVSLEPGQHTITFRYKPNSYKTGLFISLIALLGWVSFFVARSITFRYKPNSYKTGLFISLIALLGWVSFFVARSIYA
jgi:hypothetical protein